MGVVILVAILILRLSLIEVPWFLIKKGFVLIEGLNLAPKIGQVKNKKRSEVAQQK